MGDDMENREKYEESQIEIVRFDSEDIITGSSDTPMEPNNQCN